jgi:hypothetical protein
MEITDIGLYVTYVILIIGIVVAVVLPTISAIKNPAGLLKSLFGLGGLVVLFVVAYALSGDEVTTVAASLGVDAGSSQLIGAGLGMFYIVLIVGILGIVASEINKALK